MVNLSPPVGIAACGGGEGGGGGGGGVGGTTRTRAQKKETLLLCEFRLMLRSVLGGPPAVIWCE